MGAINWAVLLLTHPFEFKTLLQFWLYHEQKRDIKAIQEHPTSGWDRESMQRCWHFLDLTSRSFAAVIKELDGDLARTICMFYLVLRGLDTVEDDMSIPDDIKQPILRSFHEKTVTPGWKFDGCGPNEKDRQLLVEYDTIVEEVNRLSPHYKAIIVDICHKMETGMADYAHKAATTGSIYLESVAEYDLYCHYVAGLVGEGLSRIFSSSEKEGEWLAEQLELSNSMGLLLQKTNIIRDYREDTDQQRYFWPREIWGQYGFKEMKEIYEPQNAERAQWVQSAMIIDALRHAEDALDYLKLLKNQSVFNFCAIPATMAIATLELCFMNPTMLQRNIKIRKADAASLIMRSTNPKDVGLIFRDFVRKIHAKAVPTDPNFLKLSVACGKIEQWYEHNYPTFIKIVETPEGTRPQMDPEDVRTRTFKAIDKRNAALAKLNPQASKGGSKLPMPDFSNSQGADSAVGTTELFMYMLAAITLVVVLSGGVVYIILKMVGEDSPLKAATRGTAFGEL
ncbi:squalene synthase [Coprinopsis marcescibilis]|uniref:Squalene synthase n=1 Tax=Coprinopsis marcescibilis TaxID=230819 RepID=A0A5C3KP40_COPMA|nr:squalene synthase [Coprinopsis marcescibilis]